MFIAQQLRLGSDRSLSCWQQYFFYCPCVNKAVVP
jgi:hypothetical protein